MFEFTPVIAVLQNPMFKRFMALASGSAAGQAIMFFALPVATQLYVPADFGVLASFSSLVLLLLPAACFRFDLAIPIPQDDGEALGLVTLAFVSATLISVFYAVALLATVELWEDTIQDVIISYWWLLVLALWSAAIFSLIQYWAIRMKKFRSLAISHVVRGLIGASSQIGMGFLSIGAFGLLVGQSIYMGMGALFLAWSLVWINLDALKKMTRFDIFAALRKNWRFPIYSTPEALFNSASANLPMILIVALVGYEAGGLLYVAQRLTSIPVGLIGGNLSRVFLSEAPELDRKKRLFFFTLRLWLTLFMSAFPLAIFLSLLAEPLTVRLFGDDWIGAAQYLSWLIPAALLQFSVVPVATVLHVKSKQLVALLVQVSGFVLQVGSIWLCYAMGGVDPVLGFAIGSAFHYGIYSIVILVSARD
ncbi:oligosaccharide flippase family protein [Kordiimonas lipolytica]|uniref:Oligosaccharide flippase family protein n=1 Tax=Kordiimonas lipolytica TaxID=1662421 RepID=A0ABV8U7C4_9PROT|nr:oligosaccharide flippase family protein [Kordiimonas lipolytica]